MPRTLLFSGFELRAPELPPDARLLLPPIRMPAVEGFASACERALEEPLGGPPFSSMLAQGTKVAVVVDDPSLPVPPMFRDPRRDMVRAVVRVLGNFGVRPPNASVIVANGLSRMWRSSELTELFGSEVTSEWQPRCHDAEDGAALAKLSDEADGPIELNRALVEADLIVHVNVVSMPIMAGTFGLVSGTVGYRTARALNAPEILATDDAPFLRGSPYHRGHEQVGRALARKVPIFQLSAVLSNELWPPALTGLLKGEQGLTRPLQVWNALPAAVRHRTARMIRASYRPIAVLAGPPEAVAPKALEVFLRQHEVATAGEADVVAFGLPDLGPASVGAAQNPVLSANLALGYVANLFTEKPLLKQGGVIVFASPLNPVFDRKAHLPHEEFYEKVLRVERDPIAIHQRFEPYFAGRPEFVSNYQKRFAFHGMHPLFAWSLMWPARRRAARVIVAHGDPRACARLGFTPAVDVEEALQRARDFLGDPKPRIAMMELPPPFWVRVR